MTMNTANIARGDLLSGLAAYLKQSRHTHDWTLREAEKQSGIPNSHISQIERGKITDPSWRTVTALELAYGVVPYEHHSAYNRR